LSSSFCYRIPKEHQEKIDEWLTTNFQMRIDGKITRSRCLFMIGPTQHGMKFEFVLFIEFVQIYIGKTSWTRSLGKH
jgi:hypothetical protein